MGLTPSPATPPARRHKGLRARLYDVLLEMVPEGFGTLIVILIVAAGRFLLKWSMGPDAKFFDLIPIGWVFDAGDLALVGRLVWRAFKKLND
jgi:hypothetical protein